MNLTRSSVDPVVEDGMPAHKKLRQPQPVNHSAWGPPCKTQVIRTAHQADGRSCESDEEESARPSRQFLGFEGSNEYLVWSMEQHPYPNSGDEGVGNLGDERGFRIEQY